MKNHDKNKESSYIQYWNVNDLYLWAMSENLSVKNFEWIKNTSQFDEDFVKNCNEKMDEGYFLKIMFNNLKNHMTFVNIYHFYQTERKLKKSESLQSI